MPADAAGKSGRLAYQGVADRLLLRALLAPIVPRWRNLIPLLVGLLVAPFFIVVHEGAHLVVARSLGIRAELHYAATTVHYSRLAPPPSDLLVTAAGPVIQALLAGGGLIWLYRLRRYRRLEPASWIDCVATWVTFNGGRWLGASAALTFAGTALKDEVVLLRASDLPIWLGLALLGLGAIGFLWAALRLHPPGGRLVPFAYAGLGGIAAVHLWMRWLGPLLLP